MELLSSKGYDVVVVGACNLEVCVEDSVLAEKLLNRFPEDRNRKLYPGVKLLGNSYVVCPSAQFAENNLKDISGGKHELLIDVRDVKRRLAAGGGANASKVLAKLGAKVLLVTSIGSKDDPNYETMSDSLKEYPQIQFLDIPGRSSVGLTLNIYGGGKQSTLLIHRGSGRWKEEEFEKGIRERVKNLDLQGLPVVAIALSPDYLSLLQVMIEEKGEIEYFCPSRTHIDILKSRAEDGKYFEKSLFVQANVEEVADIYSNLYRDGRWSKTKDEDVAKIMKEHLKNWSNHIIATRSREGVYFLKEGTSDIISFSACQKLPGQFVDDTGAGDAFAGAFFWSHFIRGKQAEEAIEFASTFAAYSVTGIGATGRLPEAKEVEGWVREYGPNSSVVDP